MSATSTLNSTSTPLGVSASWAGTAESTLGVDRLHVAVQTDADGTLYVEYSTDSGSTWDHQSAYTISAGIDANFEFHPAADTYRVRYVNGTSAQSYMRLSTLMHKPGADSSNATGTGGGTLLRVLNLDETGAGGTITSAARLHSIVCSNASPSVTAYLKLYDLSAAPTVGTDTVAMTVFLPASSVVSIDLGGKGLAFANGISYACTSGAADADVGAAPVGLIHLNLGYSIA